MLVLNKFIKLMAFLGIKLLILLEEFFIALMIASPVMCIAWSIIDRKKLALPVSFLFVWLGLCLIITIPIFLYVELKLKKLNKQK